MNEKKILLVGLVIAVIFAPLLTVFASERGETVKRTVSIPQRPAVSLSDREAAVEKTKQALTTKAKEVQTVIKDFIGSSFDKQCAEAIENVKKNPNSWEPQIETCNILMAWADKLHNSFESAKQADLTTRRDAVVKALRTISDLKAEEAKKYQSRANEAKGAWKTRYEQFSTACLNFSKGYLLHAERYEKIPVADQMIEVQACLEYLDCAKEVISGLREYLIIVRNNDESLQQLLVAYQGVTAIHASIVSFSEEVLNSAIRAGEEPVTTQPKARPEPGKKAA